MRKNTLEKLNEVLDSFLTNSKEEKINISSIAKQVGISHSTIYNCYPKIVERIKLHNFLLQQPEELTKEDKIKKLIKEKSNLNLELAKSRLAIQKLVSINASYEIENSRLNSEIESLKEEKSNLIRSINSITPIK
ncbi:hypothetical protein Q4519_03380 [Motilimonas sp. 1_MG-2023]|uniref:hypothetical protein n=1 Tax=Motilimonas sp. 1_MG-2023 TaxID=3062672 RepID=UPI0026E1D32A|nr:hypothetical protein [Motilimonas sp. 1_MG-2023]MDO6524719.1 hypothetical protein [Motilimonas sp. 1_MG-2023]